MLAVVCDGARLCAAYAVYREHEGDAGSAGERGEADGGGADAEGLSGDAGGESRAYCAGCGVCERTIWEGQDVRGAQRGGAGEGAREV